MPGFQDALTSSSVPVLGLKIPEGFDQAVEAGEPIALQSAFAHWVKPEQRLDLETHFEAKLSAYFDLPVEILPGPADFFPSETTGGHLWMVTMGFVTITFLLGGFIVPLLLTDEKASKTLDTLLVSPASYSDVVLGKAAAGMFYCIFGLAALSLIECRFIAHGWLMTLTILLNSLTSVSIGLLLGSLSENPNTTNLWAGLILMALLAPVLLIFVFPSGFPAAWGAIAEWIPSIAMMRLIRLAMADEVNQWGLLTSLWGVNRMVGCASGPDHLACTARGTLIAFSPNLTSFRAPPSTTLQ